MIDSCLFLCPFHKSQEFPYVQVRMFIHRSYWPRKRSEVLKSSRNLLSNFIIPVHHFFFFFFIYSCAAISYLCPSSSIGPVNSKFSFEILLVAPSLSPTMYFNYSCVVVTSSLCSVIINWSRKLSQNKTKQKQTKINQFILYLIRTTFFALHLYY